MHGLILAAAVLGGRAHALEFKWQDGRCRAGAVYGMNKGLGPCGDARFSQISDQNLHGRDLTGADVSGSVLARVDLGSARAAYAGFNRVEARGLVANEAGLESADFRGATLDTALFDHARLTGADLRGARARAASFAKADLRNARLQWAVLLYADFSGADLRGADLSGAFVLGASFTGASFDQRTRLPFHEDRARELGLVKASGPAR